MVFSFNKSFPKDVAYVIRVRADFQLREGVV